MIKNLSKTASLAVSLIKIPSITPNDLGCIDLVRQRLSSVNFSCLTLKDSGTDNLLATHGQGSPFFLFLGHTDVVSPGNESEWSIPPFSAKIDEIDGVSFLHGRGSQDMKGSDAAMTEALVTFVKNNPNHKGTVGLLLTSNEEGDAVGGTTKNGRRGSVTAHITVKGIQGHVAYPKLCDNAAHHAGRLINALSTMVWDEGSEFFPPTSFQVTNIKCGTGAENVVPGTCYIMCNWRYNDALNKDKIASLVDEIVKKEKIECSIKYVVNGLPFITKGGLLLDAVQKAISDTIGEKATVSTAGGTSDGRFIAPLGTKVVEFGPRANLIHKVNEAVELDSLDKLHDIYVKTLINLALRA